MRASTAYASERGHWLEQTHWLDPVDVQQRLLLDVEQLGALVELGGALPYAHGNRASSRSRSRSSSSVRATWLASFSAASVPQIHSAQRCSERQSHLTRHHDKVSRCAQWNSARSVSLARSCTNSLTRPSRTLAALRASVHSVAEAILVAVAVSVRFYVQRGKRTPELSSAGTGTGTEQDGRTRQTCRIPRARISVNAMSATNRSPQYRATWRAGQTVYAYEVK